MKTKCHSPSHQRNKTPAHALCNNGFLKLQVTSSQPNFLSKVGLLNRYTQCKKREHWSLPQKQSPEPIFELGLLHIQLHYLNEKLLEGKGNFYSSVFIKLMVLTGKVECLISYFLMVIAIAQASIFPFS